MNVRLCNDSLLADAESRHFKTATPTRNILYVEDDAVLREVFAELLLNSGYLVDVARDGQAGWEALQLRSYDLLITDNDMPRLSGLELIKRLRSTGSTLPVVVASGSYEPDRNLRDDWLRVAAIVSKPFDPAELLDAVRRVLRAGDLGSTARGLPPSGVDRSLGPHRDASPRGPQ